MRHLILTLVCLGTAACAVDGAVRDRAAEEISEQQFRANVEKLASDEFEGRKPASRGEQLTVEFLEQQFLALGLQPASGGSFRQGVPLVEITATGESALTVSSRSAQLPLRVGDDIVLWSKRVQPAVRVENSELVFVGYGINAPEYGWNDYAGVDMHGKTAVVLINDPGYATGDPALFKGRALTYHGRWTYKFEEAARQGAAAVMIIHETAPAAYGWATVRNSWLGPQFDLDRADGDAGHVAIESWVTYEAAARMFALAGLDLGAEKAAAAQRGFKAVPLGLKVSGGVRNIIRRSESQNVVGLLPGSEHPDEYVIYMAHWDHLGRSLQLAGGRDTIFNGAVDNATGVAGLLEIARAYRAMLPRPKRSVLFLAVTAEESNLLGSAYYAAHPVVPLERTAAAINIDGMAPLGRARDIVVVGYGASELEDYLAAAARRQGRVVRPDPKPENGYFYRSDHFNLAHAGVPSLYVDSGTDVRDRPAGWAQAQLEDYTARRYHQVGDNYDPAWDVSGMLEDLVLAFQVGARVAGEERWPNWYAGNEFRATRDASAAARTGRP